MEETWLDHGGRVQLYRSVPSQQFSREMTAGGNGFLWWTIPLKFTLTADSATVCFSSSCGTEPCLPQLMTGQSYNTWLVCSEFHMLFTMWKPQLPCWPVHCIARRAHQLRAQEPWQLTQTSLYASVPLPSLSWRGLGRPMATHWGTAGWHFCYMEQIPDRAYRQKKNKHCLILTIFIVFP